MASHFRIASPPFFVRKESIFELTRKRIGIGNLKSLLVPLSNSVITFLLEGDRTNQHRKPWEKSGMGRINRQALQQFVLCGIRSKPID